jgi:hypothetical protein
MLFSDSGVKRAAGDPERLLPLLQEGALLMLDDFTPGVREDSARTLWLEHPAFRAVEVTVSAEAAVILARRR